MSSSTSQSHATDPVNDSKVPLKAQEKVPAGVEDSLPESVHETGNKDKVSHDKGHTIVPKAVAEALPKSVEEKVPDAVHDTTGLKSAEKGVEKGL